MAKVSKGAVSVAELGEDPARVVRRVRGSKEPVLVMQRGRAQVVLMSVEAYQRNQQERELLRELARGEREIAAGRGSSLESVLADADKVLKRTRR